MAATRWVSTWVSAPQLAEPPASFTATTLRQTIQTSIGGDRVRLRLSNVFGGAELPVAAVSVALPAGGKAGTSGTQAATAQPVTFSGLNSVVVPAGTDVVSDPVPVPV